MDNRLAGVAHMVAITLGAAMRAACRQDQKEKEAETQQLQASFDRIQSVVKLYHALGGMM